MPDLDPFALTQIPHAEAAALTSPMGATPHPAGVDFAVFAGGASLVELCLYSPDEPAQEVARLRLTRGEAGVWRTRVLGLPTGTLYGYRAHGAWNPGLGHRYNARKLLLDPYARAIVGDCRSRLDMLTMPGPLQAPGSTDNGATALKSAVVEGHFDWGDDTPPRTPWAETILYELHVKGFSQLHPAVPRELRGTYAGLAHPASIHHLTSLGITAVQLLPVHQHLDDGFLLDRGLTNYWGYNTIGFFAPHTEYASAHQPESVLAEFKTLVKTLHSAGIEVILDVVYNHTGEGNEFGPTLMFRGLDNTTYYHLIQSKDGLHYHNMTGCGNGVASYRAASLRLHLDSLRYWVTEMHVDGFRFDLAVTTARGPHGYDRHSPFLTAIAQDPILSTVKLIAEPWDVGEMDSYQVGNFPAPWRELNGRFRDAVRRYWRGDPGTTASFAKRLSGSEDMYDWDQRPPTSSVNFITSHDGFTLRDLVSYESKHNEANGENNNDGDNENHSSNGGVEGETRKPAINQRRKRRARSLIATVFVSRGIPFLTAGDERWRTQRGNNNSYCQDNDISWIDWTDSDDAAQMQSFVSQLITFRKHTPALHSRHFFTGQVDPVNGLADVTWLDSDSTRLLHQEWHQVDRYLFGMLINADRPLLLLFNQSDTNRSFTLPGHPGSLWQTVFDTSLDHPFDPPEKSPHRGTHPLPALTVVCLQLVPGSRSPAIPA